MCCLLISNFFELNDFHTACDLEKSFSFDTTVEIPGYLHFLNCVYSKHVVINVCYISEICKLERFQTVNLQGHARSQVSLPFDRPYVSSCFLISAPL